MIQKNLVHLKKLIQSKKFNTNKSKLIDNPSLLKSIIKNFNLNFINEKNKNKNKEIINKKRIMKKNNNSYNINIVYNNNIIDINNLKHFKLLSFKKIYL